MTITMSISYFNIVLPTENLIAFIPSRMTVEKRKQNPSYCSLSSVDKLSRAVRYIKASLTRKKLILDISNDS